MRPKERIPIFLTLISWTNLCDRWGCFANIPNGVELEEIVCSETVLNYWKENPDQRIGQVLINLELLPDNFEIWKDEENDILKDQGVNPREFLFWTSIYDKYENLLKEPKARLIKDMDTSHIRTILELERKNNWILSKLYKDTFTEELIIREDK